MDYVKQMLKKAMPVVQSPRTNSVKVICLKSSVRYLNITDQLPDLGEIEDRELEMPDHNKFLSRNANIPRDHRHQYYSFEKYRVSIHAKTDVGKYHNPNLTNQDCVGYRIADGRILAECNDGVGVSMGAEIASSVACAEVLRTPTLNLSLIHRIQKKLQSKLDVIERRIENSFPLYSQHLKNLFLLGSLKTTLQILEIDLLQESVTILKLGDGEIHLPDAYFPDTEGNRTLCISPFLSPNHKFPFNSHPQAIFIQKRLVPGVYIISTDGIRKICPQWFEEAKVKPHYSVDRITGYAKNSDSLRSDNLGVVVMEIEAKGI